MKAKRVLKLFSVLVMVICLTVTSAAPALASDTAVESSTVSDTESLSEADDTGDTDGTDDSDDTDGTDDSDDTDATDDSDDTDGTDDSDDSDGTNDTDDSTDTDSTDDSGDTDSQEEADDTIDLSPASVTLSASSFTYTGSAITPTVTVKLSGTTLTKGTDYTVSYSNNQSIGTASVTVTGTGNYNGSVTASFQIIPATVTISSASWGDTAAVTVKWSAVSGSFTGYQIRYRTEGSSSWKTVSVSASNTSCTLSSLSSSKKYQIQVRAYKGSCYGDWSSTKTVKSRYQRTVKISGSNTTLHHTAGTWTKKNGYKYYTIKSTGKKAKKTFLNIKGSVYYFDSKGRMYTSWHKIGSDYYFFNRSSGKLASNTTVDKVKVTKYGVLKKKSSYIKRVKVIISAREFMEDNTKATDSKSAKLKKCFKALFKYPYKQYRKLKNIYKKADWELTFANDIFVRGKGCCVSTSSALAFIARECGYTNVYIAHDSGHAWVMINGYVYDNLFAEARGWSGNYHGSKKGDYRTNPPYKRSI